MSSRRLRASSSVIWPAFRSASIAICLPGMASRVKRAATSATRPAPFVMTTNWMTMRIRKMTRPTTTLPPTTKLPNASTTWPASPSSRMSRVTETLIARRNSVVSSSSDGNDGEVQRARQVERRDDDRQRDRDVQRDERSSSTGGSGTISITTTRTTTPAATRSVYFMTFFEDAGHAGSDLPASGDAVDEREDLRDGLEELLGDLWPTSTEACSARASGGSGTTGTPCSRGELADLAGR